MCKILIVDDNDNNRLTLNLLLEEIEGVEVHEAEDGQIAVEMCVKHTFDLIFMDIMMPHMDGFEATKYIKQLHKETMIIALSALDDEESKHKMLALGAEDYLCKPVNARLFEVRIRHYLKIIALRSRQRLGVGNNVLNPFNKAVYSRTLSFRIEKEEDLAEYWDYWLKGEKTLFDVSDCVRLMYGFGLWLLRNEVMFTIVVEENAEHVYMMLMHHNAIKSSVIKNILYKHFPNAKYILTKEMLSFALKRAVETIEHSLEVNAEIKEVLSKSHENVTSAARYVEETAISFMPKIDSLEMINDDLDRAILTFEKEPNARTLGVVCDNFQEYAEVLEALMDFAHLGFAVQTLINFLTTLTEDQFDEVKVKKTAAMLLNLVHDLNAWRENVFITQVARDIHYLDASLLSSCIQIEAIFEEKSADIHGDDELEFF